MGTAQGVLSWIVAVLSHHLNGVPISLTPIAFTIVYGTLIGIFMSTYINWTYRGPVISQFFKSALISAIYAFPLILFTHGFAAMTLLVVALTLSTSA